MQRDLDTGRLVGRYMVHRRIAAGGMATVHLGRLLGAAGFSRTVAIKRLHDGYARDPEFVAMLLDEARLASTIRHPNVVPTLDVVAEEDELLVVMDYVAGDSLAHLHKLAFTAGERFPVGIAAAVVAQSLHGLHAAHEARDKNGVPLGIVHRDVSPQNVLVGVDGVARVLDFGIAKAASRATTTEDGQLKGKTAYMAPEQLQHGAVDRRTDVFAAAIMLWELLAGRRLFLADSPAQTMARVLTDPILPPQKWAPDLPPALGAIALRGLERDPNKRFSTAEEMALAIEDAIKLPRAKDIGEWVSRVAAEVIDARSALVREIERSSAPMQAHTSTDPALRAAMQEAERRRHMADQPTHIGSPGLALGVPAQWAVSSSARHQGFIRGTPPTPRSGGAFRDDLTDLATVRSSANFIIAPDRRVARVSVLVGVIGGLALAAAVGVAFIITRDRGAHGRVDARPPPPIAMLSASVSEPTSTPSGSPPLTPLGTVASASPPTAPPSASATPTARKPTPRGNGAPATAGAKPDCRIPYIVDDKGLKHFKVECL